MKKWGKWILGFCVCLLVVCAMGTVALANENAEMDEVQWLTQKIEDVQQQMDDLNTKIDEMDIDYFRDEFNRLEDKMLTWATIVIAVIVAGITAATIIGTWVMPQRTINETKKAEKALGYINKDIEQQRAALKEINILLERNQEASSALSIGLYQIQIKEYEEAISCFKEAVRLYPNMHIAWNSWGFALNEIAINAIDSQAEVLFKEACEKYSKATEIKPDFPGAWYNLGNTLFNLALICESEKEEYFEEACEKYQKATDIKPSFASAWYNWGNALCNLAELNHSIDKYRESCAKYEEVIKLNPRKLQTYEKYIVALNGWAGLTDDDKIKHDLLEKINVIVKAIEEIKGRKIA